MQGVELSWSQKLNKKPSAEQEKLCAFFMPKIRRRYNASQNKFGTSESGRPCLIDDGNPQDIILTNDSTTPVHIVRLRGSSEGWVMQLVDITESEETLQAWRSFMEKQFNNADSAYQIYMMTNKPYGLTFLKYAAYHLSKTDFSKILADAWIRSENPNNDANVSKSKLIAMFKQAEPSELQQYDELEDTVTVYRGVTSYNGKNIKALSWTLDREKAEWFAHRFDEDGTVYEAQIEKKHILALFNGRNESEVIVNPNYLIDITVSEEPAQALTQTM